MENDNGIQNDDNDQSVSEPDSESEFGSGNDSMDIVFWCQDLCEDITNDPAEVYRILCTPEDEFSDVDWDKVFAFLRQCNALQSIDLQGCELPEDITSIVLGSEGPLKNSPIEELDFDFTECERNMEALLSFVRSKATLRSIHVSGTNLRTDDAALLLDALNDSRVIKLDIRTDNIGDEAVEDLLSAPFSKLLVRLTLFGRGTGRRTADAICQFLRCGETMLEEFYLCPNDGVRIVFENAQMIMQSLSDNSRLKAIYVSVGATDENSYLEVAQSLVCDQSSFDSMCQSNHQL